MGLMSNAKPPHHRRLKGDAARILKTCETATGTLHLLISSVDYDSEIFAFETSEGSLKSFQVIPNCLPYNLRSGWNLAFANQLVDPFEQWDG